jgi:tetratricopeptide (TPR) repeat protein
VARLAWSAGSADADAVRSALGSVASLGPEAALFASVERVRIAREAGDAAELARATRAWFEAGGGLTAALEWLAREGEPFGQAAARDAVADALGGEAGESVHAWSALASIAAAAVHPDRSAGDLVDGESMAVRLVNLELAPPGSDPRRRAVALAALGGALGDDAGIEAAGLAAWSTLVAGDLSTASAAFERATALRPDDLAAWEGLRACAEQAGDARLRARAASELGTRCADDARGAAFWEEAALLLLDMGAGDHAEAALDASFARDARRPVAFDKLFRRVRERKDNDKLLALIERRFSVADDRKEITKLYWEQARALREKGDQDGALAALEHVTTLEPDHVGALALLGEVCIRRGRFEEAATSLSRLALVEAAPAKNRVTAGVAAVDIFENKLNRVDKALEVLLALHKANLSTLPVRERLARVAARTGAWKEATAILEVLMNERAAPAGRIEAARLAMAIHRDRLGDAQRGAAAIVKLLQESPTDGEALDMLVQTDHPASQRAKLLTAARGGLLEIVGQRPSDLANVKRLAKVARALGDGALEQVTLSVAIAVGGGDPQPEHAFAQLSAGKPRTPQIAITREMLVHMLAPGDEGAIADLFALLGPTIAEALGPTLQACGVGRRDKIDPRSGLAVRNEIATWAGAFGVHEFDLYVGGKDPMGVQGVPGETPALVVGAGVNAPLAPMTRARIARELLAMARGTTVTRSRDDVTIAAIVVAACKLGEVPIQHPPYAVLADVEKVVGKAIARKTKKMLPDVCRVIAATGADARAWYHRALASHARVSLVASGDVVLALADALGETPDRLPAAAKSDPRAEELLRFALSPTYAELRRTLGLEGAR